MIKLNELNVVTQTGVLMSIQQRPIRQVLIRVKLHLKPLCFPLHKISLIGPIHVSLSVPFYPVIVVPWVRGLLGFIGLETLFRGRKEATGHGSSSNEIDLLHLS